MINVQLFVPVDNPKGTAYGPYLASLLEGWVAWVKDHGKDGEKQYQKKAYVMAEINSLKNGLVSDMGASGRFTPVYSLALVEGIGMGAICKRGNGSNKANHKISLILSLPDKLSKIWPKPSPTSILFAEAAKVALEAKQPLKLDSENDDLVKLYQDAYGFEVSGDKFGERTPMELKLEGLNTLVNRYKQGTHWKYAKPLPHPG